MMPQNGGEIIDAQNTEISISADRDFIEIKKDGDSVQKTESWQVCICQKRLSIIDKVCGGLINIRERIQIMKFTKRH